MTVHGAKGLEAPIVILADAATTEAGRDRRSIFMQASPPLFFNASSKETHVAETMTHRSEAEAAQKAEYWRKLYVAMTRAEDELYVTGALTNTGRIDGTWYEAIEQALRPEARVITADGNETALVYGDIGEASATVAPDSTGGTAPLNLPELPAYSLRRIVRPSRAGEDADLQTVLGSAAERLSDPRDPEAARREGIALHALLHHLSLMDAGQREDSGRRALADLLSESVERQEAILQRALSILVRPELAALFSPQSRPEVPILAKGTQNGRPILVAGRIDRLVVEADRVLIVDFKSDDEVPGSEAGVPPAYLRQLGLYALVAGQLFPDKAIAAGILWTSLESFMILTQSRLRQEVAGFTLR